MKNSCLDFTSDQQSRFKSEHISKGNILTNCNHHSLIFALPCVPCKRCPGMAGHWPPCSSPLFFFSIYLTIYIFYIYLYVLFDSCPQSRNSLTSTRVWGNIPGEAPKLDILGNLDELPILGFQSRNRAKLLIFYLLNKF